MAIDVLKAGSDGYEANRGVFNVLLSQEPAAIVVPRDAADVIEAIAYAKAEGLRVGAQRTGHSAEPLGDLSGTLLLRTAAMNAVSIDAERRIARVGAGALWGTSSRRPPTSGWPPATAPRRPSGSSATASAAGSAGMGASTGSPATG